MNSITEFEKQLDKTLSAYPVFQQAERQTGLRKTHLVAVAAILLLTAILHYTIFPNLLPAVLCLAYPLFATAQAADGHDKAEDVQWLSFWLCYGLLTLVVDVVGRPVLTRLMSRGSLELVRTLVAIFLWAPMTKGASLAWHVGLKRALHWTEAACPGLRKNGAKDQGGKKKQDVAKTINEMRNRSKSGSGDEH